MTEQKKPNFQNYDYRECVPCREGRHNMCEYRAVLAMVDGPPVEGEDFFDYYPTQLGRWCGCFHRDQDRHYDPYDGPLDAVETSVKKARSKSGAVELSTSWEVLFRPYKTSLKKVGGFEAMFTQIQDVIYRPETPTWRDEVQLAGHSDKEINFVLDLETAMAFLFAPDTMETFQDWVMQTVGELGYEGWSVVNRIVTAQVNDG